MSRPEFTDAIGDLESILTKLQRTKPVSELKLGEKQERFSFMLGCLLIKMQLEGYDARIGDVYATTGHTKNSCHYQKLAGDINLFKDGKFLTATEDHKIFGEWWERFGGSWGGRFRDGNHYSLAHGGSK